MEASLSVDTIKVLAEELNEELVGKKVLKVQQVGRELFKITFGPGKKELLIEPGKRIHLTQYVIQAPLKASQAAMFLRKHLKGEKVKRVYQYDEERIIVIEFEDYFLISEFFSHGNMVLADKEFTILFTFRKEEWKDRVFKKGEKYLFPKNPHKVKKGFSPVGKEKYEEHGSMNKALDEYFSAQTKQSESPLIKKLKIRLEQQMKALKEFEEKAKIERQKADKIYENYQLVEEVLRLVKEKKYDELKQKGVELKKGKIIINLD